MSYNILVVDDEEDIIDITKRKLELTGFNVKTATDGADALDKALNEVFDLIVLDIVLPNLNGTEIFKELKKNAPTANIPVIILTAHADLEEQMREEGVTDFITKPFATRDLINRIENYLS